jgi:hypothetical protein
MGEAYIVRQNEEPNISFDEGNEKPTKPMAQNCGVEIITIAK